MADEKSSTSIPPAYDRFEMPSSPVVKPILKQRTQKILLGYAAAITAAFIVATILGGVYYANSMYMYQTQTDALLKNLKEIQVASTSQKVAVDTTNGVSVFYPQGPGVPNGTVAAIDYKRSVTGIYDPQTRECYVTAGIPTGAPNAMALQEELNSGNYATDSQTRVYYRKVDNIAVQDHSVLPSPLQSICQGLPVYWMEKAEAPASQNTTAVDNDRSKRATIAYSCYSGTVLYYPTYFCCRAQVCIYIGGGYWYCYWYCYFCRTYGGVGSLVYYSYSC